MKYDWSKENIEKAVENSDSYSDTLRKMNIPLQGNNSKTLKDKIEEYKIDISHFTFEKQYKEGLSNFKYIPASEYLGTNKQISSSKLKEKLIKEGIKENKCEICGISEWLNKPIICQLHHINGNHSDNRLENLQMLCPNCHSQTDNYCGSAIEKQHYYCKDCGTEITRGATYCVKCLAKHHRKVDRPSKEELLQLYKELKSLSAIGRKYGVRDNTIKKWFISYELPGKASELKKLL